MKSKILLFALALLLLATGAYCESSLFVAEPAIYNAPELASSVGGIRAMVAGRVAGDGYRVDTGDKPASDAAWTLKLTITQLMGAFSVDAALEPLAAGGQGARASERANKPDELMAAIEKVSEAIKGKLSTPKSEQTPPAQVQPVAKPSFSPSDIFKNPKVMLEIAGEVKSLVSMDVTPAQGEELVALADKELYLIEFKDGALDTPVKFKPEFGFKPLLLNSFDIDGDKSPELLVFGSNFSSGFTQAYKFDGKAFVAFGKKANAYIRTMDSSEGKILVGLKSYGGVEVFQKTLYKVSFADGEFSYGDKMETPAGWPPLVNADWINLGGSTWLFAVDQDNKLSIFDGKLNRAYRGDEIIKGSTLRIEGEIKDPRMDSTGAIFEFAAPTFAIKTPDNGVYAIIHDNIDESNYVPRRWGSYSKGTILALQWDGLAMQKAAKSAEYEGYFSAFAVINNPLYSPSSSFVGVLVADEGMIVSSKKSKFVVFKQ